MFQVEVMFDLLDPQIYICSPIVLALFSDNFDIQGIQGGGGGGAQIYICSPIVLALFSDNFDIQGIQGGVEGGY